MKTAEKPLITSTTVTVRVQRYGTLIANERKALPELTKRVNENVRKRNLSRRTMLALKRK